MIIFKSLWRQKPLLKSQKCRTCYAGRGLRSGTPCWGYPSHRYRGWPLPFTKPWAATPLRRPLSASHVWTMNYFRDWPCQYDIDLNKKGEWYCGKLRCLSKTWLHLLDKSTRILWDIHVVWTRAIWFSTLLATAVLYYILTIRKLADSMNVKRQVRKGGGLGMSTRTAYTYNILTHNKLQQKTKPTNVKRVENYSHPRKHNRVENYTHT